MHNIHFPFSDTQKKHNFLFDCILMRNLRVKYNNPQTRFVQDTLQLNKYGILFVLDNRGLNKNIAISYVKIKKYKVEI